MFYFIPAWYHSEREWGMMTEPWYRYAKKAEFDDSVNQIKLFQNANESVSVILLNYSPHLRYFLKRHDLFEVEYVSVFDIFQNTRNIPQKLLDISDFNWPLGVEFIHTSFVVSVLKEGALYANVEFGEEGYIIWIDFFENNQLIKKYVLDDRGFLSSIIYYKEGKIDYQEYLDITGTWQIRVHEIPEKIVEINPNAIYPFKRETYNTVDDLLEEYLQTTDLNEKDTLIIASHDLHNTLLFSTLKNMKKVASFFGERDTKKHYLPTLLVESDLVIADTEFKERDLKQIAQQNGIKQEHIHHLPPVDTRLKLGLSQRLKESIIYVLIDDLTRQELDYIVRVVIEKMEKYPLDIMAVTYKQSVEEVMRLFEEMETNDVTAYFDIQDYRKMTTIPSNELEEEKHPQSKLTVVQIKKEMDLIQSLKYARLIVDLSNEPDIFLQIAGISAGIPQVNKQGTHYVTHKSNGYIVDSVDKLPLALDYYLDGLKNWNISLVKSVELLNAYASGELLKKWKYYLDGGSNS